MTTPPAAPPAPWPLGLWGEIMRAPPLPPDGIPPAPDAPAAPLALDRLALVVLAPGGGGAAGPQPTALAAELLAAGLAGGPAAAVGGGGGGPGPGAAGLALDPGHGLQSGTGDSSPAPAPPSNRREAAARNLEAIDQTLERVRDAVERQALQQERERMQAELERGDLVIVVFGTGSTGKTSLIRALLQELVGDGGGSDGLHPIGATRYRLRLRGLSRAVILEDTPGILEAGQEGRRAGRGGPTSGRPGRSAAAGGGWRSAGQRNGRCSRPWPAWASGSCWCSTNATSGASRRSNACWPCCGGAARAGSLKEDVVAGQPSPQTVPMPGGRPYQPAPEVEALLRRIAEVLHADGEELIADNLLLQCRELGDASRQLLDRQRRQDAEQIVDRYMWIGAGVLMVTPLPGVDLLGTAAVNAQMVMEIGRVYGVQLSRASAQDLALSVGRTLAGLGLIKGGVALLTSALSLNLPALLVSRAIQAVSAAWLTRVAGRSFITYFQQDQDWGDGGVQEVLQRQYDLNRREGALRHFLDWPCNGWWNPFSGRACSYRPSLAPAPDGLRWWRTQGTGRSRRMTIRR